MAAKKLKREIVISQQTDKEPKGIVPSKIISSSDRFLDTSTNTVAQKIGGLILAQAIYEDLGTKIEHMEKQINALPYADIIKALVEEGVMVEGETPVFTVINKSGTKISKELIEKTSTSFDMSSFKAYISDPDHYEGLPDEYKVIKHDILSSTEFKRLYQDDAIAPAYKKFFTLTTEQKNSFKTVKTGD